MEEFDKVADLEDLYQGLDEHCGEIKRSLESRGFGTVHKIWLGGELVYSEDAEGEGNKRG